MEIVRAPAAAPRSGDAIAERLEREAVTAVQILDLFDVGRQENSRKLAILADPDNMGKRITITAEDLLYRFRIETFAGNRGAAAQQLLQTDIFEFGLQGQFLAAASLSAVMHESPVAAVRSVSRDRQEAEARRAIQFLHGRFAVDAAPLASVSLGESLRQIALRGNGEK